MPFGLGVMEIIALGVIGLILFGRGKIVGFAHEIRDFVTALTTNTTNEIKKVGS